MKVNTKPVTLPAHRVTGRQVKEAAIAQGVEILGGKPGDQLHPIQIFARAYGRA